MVSHSIRVNMALWRRSAHGLVGAVTTGQAWVSGLGVIARSRLSQVDELVRDDVIVSLDGQS